jgi:two-component system response regulator HydG
MADLRPLAQGFLARLADLAHRPTEGLTPAAEDRLLAYRWPGNVAELATVIERAARRAAGGPIGAQHLDLPEGPAAAGWEPAGEPRPLRDVTDEYIAHVLRLTGGNRTRAARLLGVARETLRTRIRSRAAAY